MKVKSLIVGNFKIRKERCLCTHKFFVVNFSENIEDDVLQLSSDLPTNLTFLTEEDIT